MKSAKSRAACQSLLSLTLAVLAAGVSAQGYPSKPVRIILPYLGATEFAGRWLAGKLGPALGQQVVVDPRVGAGGKIGHDLAAKSPPDGYNLVLTAPPLVINPHLYPKAVQDPLQDFVPIAMLGKIPSVLVVHPSVPATSVRELVQLARNNPGKLTYGSGAAGSPSHLAGALLRTLSKTNILLVPYKGATFALVGAMSGEVDVVMPAASAAAPYVQSKRMRALAVLNTSPVKSMPGVPTAAAAGMPQLLIVNWFVLAAPAGTPRAIVERLNAEVGKAMQGADTLKQFDLLGGEVAVNTPEQAGAFVRAEYERWGRVIRDANITVTP